MNILFMDLIFLMLLDTEVHTEILYYVDLIQIFLQAKYSS